MNPAEGLMKFSGISAGRGVLTIEEARRLFLLEWADERARVGSLLSMTTGLRAGEVIGVQVRDIGTDRLHVRHSWSNQDGLKSPKTGVERTIPLLATVREALLSLARKNPHGIGPTSFVFWSVRRADRPMDFHFLLDGLKDTLLKLSLTEVELRDPKKIKRARKYWKQRAVVFHSWRKDLMLPCDPFLVEVDITHPTTRIEVYSTVWIVCPLRRTARTKEK
jgi:integrase